MGKGKGRGLLRRYGILLLGLTIMAFGIAFSIKASLGTSPVSSLPYVMSRISGLTVGTTTILLHIFLIILQILILGRKYQLIQLSQLLVALIFGCMTDGAVWCLRGIVCPNYAAQWLCCLVGILLVGIGVGCEVIANVVVLAGEGLVIAICQVVPVKFGTMKVIVDLTMVGIAIALSLICLRGLYGVREGTVAAALLVGQVARSLVNRQEGHKVQ